MEKFSMKNPKILYVEDDSLTRMMLKNQLKSRYTEVYDAANGSEGLEKYKEIKPDLVITDISMPVMNGHEMIENIKSLNSEAKIIVTTAYRDDDEKLINLRVIDKPIIVEKLFNAIADVV